MCSSSDEDDDDDLDDLDDDDLEEEEKVALAPGANADDMEEISRHVPKEILDLYDVYSYRHAAGVLQNSFRSEFQDVVEALKAFSITVREIGLPGGNKSEIPKKLSRLLSPTWRETRIQGDLSVRLKEYEVLDAPVGKKPQKKLVDEKAIRKIENYIDGHKIDYVKGRVAFDLEWNSKDQTFDRDLFALRTFHECGVISVGILLTRSEKLNPLFPHIHKLNKKGEQLFKPDGSAKTVEGKYGASTTWMGKLLYRLNAGRHGGCPVLVLGITPKIVSDWIPPTRGVSEPRRKRRKGNY
jgi:hypothetical protein